MAVVVEYPHFLVKRALKLLPIAAANESEYKTSVLSV
jgi:hypothetical protein